MDADAVEVVAGAGDRLIARRPVGSASRADLAAFGERCLTASLRQLTGHDPFGVDLKVNYLGPPASGEWRAEIWVVHRTRRTALVECEIRSGDRAIARISGTYLLVVDGA